MEIITLENRLPVIFETRKNTGVVAVQVWVKVGSKYEEPRIAGITHFIEHLIFKGTEEDQGRRDGLPHRVTGRQRKCLYLL